MTIQNSIFSITIRFTAFAIALSFLPAGTLAAETKASAPTDAEIAHIVVTSDQIDINAGKAAQDKTQNSKVKSFAASMVRDHSLVTKQAENLAKKLKLSPQDNDTSKTLKANADSNLATMNNLKGDAFDKAYIDQEVAFHQVVLESLDKTLIPNAKNKQLKALLVKTRPTIEAHLKHAKSLQADFNKTTASR